MTNTLLPGKKVFLCIIISIIFISCYKEQKNQSSQPVVQLKLNKIRDIYLDPGEGKIGRLESPMLINEEKKEKTMIFYDSGLNQIIISDTTGKIVTQMGKNGSGPEEFRHITSFGLEADSIVVYDGSLGLVKKFNFKGELVNSYPGPIKDNIWLRSNRIISYKGKLLFGVVEAGKSSSRNHWLSRTVAVYTTDGKFEHLFGEYDPDLTNSHELYNYPNATVEKDGYIYTTHRTSPTIQKYDIESASFISRFGVQSQNFKMDDERPDAAAPREVKNRINSQISFVGDSFVSDTYFAFYFFNFTEEYWALRNPNDKENFFNIYDHEERFLGEIRLPFAPLGMDADFVYLLEDDNPDNVKIGVYKIEN